MGTYKEQSTLHHPDFLKAKNLLYYKKTGPLIFSI